MNVHLLAPRAAVVASFLALCSLGRASTTIVTGSLNADNSVYSDPFTVGTAQNYTFATTSAATGNFLPVLTLFNATTGSPVDYTNSGLGDVSITDLLQPGSYVLDLTEFPNEAAGKLSDGFVFSSDPTATGDACGGALTGDSFVNAETCASAVSLGKNYTLDITNAPAVGTTPEPSALVLMLAPSAGLITAVRRRRKNG